MASATGPGAVQVIRLRQSRLDGLFFVVICPLADSIDWKPLHAALRLCRRLISRFDGDIS